jgi:hypothetical protein
VVQRYEKRCEKGSESPVRSQSIWTGKEPSGVSPEPTSFAVHQQLVIAIRQSIRQVRLHNPVTRNQWWVSVQGGLGCSNLARYSLALADDCSAKADGFLHNATSYELTATRVTIVPGKLIDKIDSNCGGLHRTQLQVVSASNFNAVSASVSAISSW